MDKLKWLAINYNLPTEPSRVRVAVWRSLKKLGAVNIQQSMWMLPFNEANCESLMHIADEIEKSQGDAFLMETSFVDKKDEQGVIQLFNKARDEEYAEVIEKCEDFFKEIEKETERKNFSFAEVEDNEEELDKLISWAGKVNGRDIFCSPLCRTAKEKLDECKRLFDEFSGRVYELIDKTGGDKSEIRRRKQ